MRQSYLEFAPRRSLLKSNDRRMRSAKPKVCQRGAACPYAVLTESRVRLIRRMYTPRVFGARRIVRALACQGVVVNEQTVQNVIYRKTWGHVK